MPASTDPRNTFEVVVPPLLCQDQSFEFTFHPVSPGPVKVKISMGPHPTRTGPVDPLQVPIGTPAPHSSPPAQKPSTPSRVSVGVSPIRVHRTPPRTLISRGCSPTPLFDLLPPDIAAFFNDTQMQFEATQQSMAAVRSHTRLADPDIVSVTSSDSDNEGQSSKDKTKSRSPDIVPETQVANRFAVDCLTAPTLWTGPESKRRKLYTVRGR